MEVKIMTKKKTLFTYNLNASNDGTHKIHEYICSHTPENANCVTLDFFKDVDEAMKFAKAKYKDMKFDICDHCCKKEDK